jgi:hypothetical protein
MVTQQVSSSPKRKEKQQQLSSLVVQLLGSLAEREQQLSTSAGQGTDTVAS